VTATLEKPSTVEEDIRQQNRDAIEAFVMPKPEIGQGVTWYSSGTRSGPGEMAFVLEVGRRNIVLQRASGTAEASVRHVDDPKLQLNEEQRATGAWDFTKRDKQLDRLLVEMTDLKERVKTLEDLLNEPAKKSK
jgi:hypothetical protein